MTDVSQLFRALAAAPTWVATQPQTLADVTITPTGGALGAVVTGLDAARPLSGELVLALKRALHDHLILIFKGQQLEDEAFLRFASYFGGIFRPPAEVPVLASQAATGLPPDVVPVSNAVGQGDYTGHGELTAHVDHQWTPQPSSGSLLYAIEIPKSGGQTSWYNTVQAYEDLDEATRREIDQLQLITYNPFLRPFDGSPRPLYRYADQPRIGQGFPHPLVRTHPESGRRSLFLSDKTEVEVVGYPDERGARLVERLRAHLARPEYRYEHDWEVGDIVFWDNQTTLHSRRAFDPSERRLLKRVSLAGGRPF